MTLARTAFVRNLPTEPKRRTRRCAIKECRQPFEPRSITHKVCSPACGMAFIEQERHKRERQERQAGLAKLKRKADHLADAQKAFNAFIRKRDQLAGYPCISSGRPLDWSGNNVDAGHYRSRGSAPHLRFDERNVHAQSKQENRYASGNATDYRIGLIKRIGLAAVEAVEADQTPRKWSVDELIAIKQLYRAKLRALNNPRPGAQPQQKR